LMSLQSSDEKSMILVDIGQIMRFYDDLYEKDYRFWPSKSRVKFLLNYLFTLDLWLGTQLSFVPEEDINEKLLVPFFDSRKFLQFITFNIKHCNRKPKWQQLIERFSQLKNQIRSPYLLIQQMYAGVTERLFDFYFEEVWSEAELIQIVYLLAKMTYFEFTPREPGSETRTNEETNELPSFSTSYFHPIINILLVRFLNTMRAKLKESETDETKAEMMQSLMNNEVFARLADAHEMLEASKFYTDINEDEKTAVQRLVENYLKFKLEESESV
jgi:hypothetical protein